VLLAPAAGVLATQIGFLGHDVGHLQVTRSRTRSRILGLVDGNLMGVSAMAGGTRPAPGLRLRVAEAGLMALHFVAYVGPLALNLTWPQAVLLVAIHQGVQGRYLGCSFAPNHKGMPTLDADQAADPLLRQLLTSHNIRGSAVIDAVLGGLTYQIEHHLFPSMPRANLRHAQPVVRQFCRERGISYAETSVIASYSAALSRLHEVGSALRQA
jgi:fatty acid desaturase